jgi:hypothetical protein
VIFDNPIPLVAPLWPQADEQASAPPFYETNPQTSVCNLESEIRSASPRRSTLAPCPARSAKGTQIWESGQVRQELCVRRLRTSFGSGRSGDGAIDSTDGTGYRLNTLSCAERKNRCEPAVIGPPNAETVRLVRTVWPLVLARPASLWVA